MSVTVASGEQFELTVQDAAPGLVGTISVRLEDGQNNIVISQATTSILATGVGAYTATRTAIGNTGFLTGNLPAGEYTAFWNWPGQNEATESVIVTPVGVTSPTYTTPAAVRAELGLTTETLPDETALRLISDAEDLVDGMLGAWPVDETTGRKIVQADVEAWQWVKLGRATVLVARNLYRNPGVLSSTQWGSVKGPDFWFEKRIGGELAAILTRQVIAVLDASGLRRLAGRARPGSQHRSTRPEFDRFLPARRHDGT